MLSESNTTMFRVTLYKPEIPTNTGNISRLCVATGCELILVGKLGFELENRRLKRAGLDHWDDLKLSLEPTLEPLLQQNRFICISKFAKQPIWQHDFKPNDMLVFGQETVGLPRELLQQHEEHTYGLPMPGPARSLNLSNAVAITVFEGMRQLIDRGLKIPMRTHEGDETFVLRSEK